MKNNITSTRLGYAWENEEFLADVCAFSLHSIGISAEEWAKIDRYICKASLSISLPVWIAYPEGIPLQEKLKIQSKYIYNFSLTTSETVWRIERTFRHLLFLELDLGIKGLFATVEAEIQGDDVNPSLVARDIFLDRSDKLIKEINKYFHLQSGSRKRYLRSLSVFGTGRRGILLPKDMGRKIIPLPMLSIGDFSEIAKTDQTESFPPTISLEKFLSPSRTGGGIYG